MKSGGNPTRGVGGERGFSLIEVLVVLVLMGIIATTLTVNISSTLKKQRLETAAEQFNAHVRLAQVSSAERGVGAFVVVAANGAGGHTVWMVADTDNNTQLGFDPNNPGAGPDMPILDRRVELGRDIVLATANPDPVIPGGINNWPVIGGNYVLLCDPRGLPFKCDVNPAIPFTGPVRLSMTHAEMVGMDLHPRFRFDITVSPLWHSTVNREMY